jgi:hypothetical protein
VQKAPVAAFTSEPITSLSRPYVMLRIAWLPSRGFVLSLTDSAARETTTPIIPPETLARALEGRKATLRHAGHFVELAAVDDCIRIRTGPINGAMTEGVFRPDDLERAMRVAVERPSN